MQLPTVVLNAKSINIAGAIGPALAGVLIKSVSLAARDGLQGDPRACHWFSFFASIYWPPLPPVARGIEGGGA